MTEHEQEKTIITLDYPITDGHGKRIDTLYVRRAKVRDIKMMTSKKDEAEQEMFLLHLLTGVLPEDLESLDLCDYEKLSECIKKMKLGKGKKDNKS